MPEHFTFTLAIETLMGDRVRRELKVSREATRDVLDHAYDRQ